MISNALLCIDGFCNLLSIDDKSLVAKVGYFLLLLEGVLGKVDLSLLFSKSMALVFPLR